MATSSGRANVVLGIDIGSTNLKVVALDDQGNEVANSRRPTPRSADDPSVDANELFTLLEDMVIESCTDHLAVSALCIAGIGEDGVLVDQDLEPLGPALAWFDPRRMPLFNELSKRLPQTEGLGVTTDPARTVIGWAEARRHPDADRARAWLSLTDFAACRWTGRTFLSDTLAARTAAWRITEHSWVSERVEATLGSTELLPEVLPAGTVLGPLRSPRLQAAEILTPDAVVIAGGHDHAIGGWGVDLLHPGAILDSMGTAEVVVAQSPTRHTACRDNVDLAPGIRNPGSTLLRVEELSRNVEWASQDLAVGTALQQLISGDLAPDSYLLSAAFVPGAAGGATPRFADDAPTDPVSRASAVLGALAARGGEAVRAVASLTETGGPVYAAGGWARSSGWVKAKEAVTGQPVHAIAQQEVTAVGAALLAATATARDLDPAAALSVTTSLHGG